MLFRESDAAVEVTAATSVIPTQSSNVQPVFDDAQRVITLQGACNVRSFSGLAGRHGPIPAGAFLRTGDLGHVTQSDRDALVCAGVTLDIDLRTADEQAESPDLLASDRRFEYQRISLMGAETMDFQEVMASFPETLGHAYVQWLAYSQPQFKQVFQRIAAQAHGTVLFHCTAGKDRTGVIAALLLKLAGVADAEIVHNYAISAHYLQAQPKDSAMNAQMRALVSNHPDIKRRLAGMVGTAPENMMMFLDVLDVQYGGAEAYLRLIGISDAEIVQLLRRLGQVG